MDRLDALRLFVDVAEAGSFSAVARGRHVAVSTVTLAARQLEQDLYAVYPGGGRSRRVAALIDFMAAELALPAPAGSRGQSHRAAGGTRPGSGFR